MAVRLLTSILLFFFALMLATNGVVEGRPSPQGDEFTSGSVLSPWGGDLGGSASYSNPWGSSWNSPSYRYNNGLGFL
ncbi:hypothetical protein M3Y99_01866900 [Aphelenchoides fujianensis]|nr:hypothetical protein M3Y99_01866900 [Aphelenchoides fujianensis]